MDIAAWLRNLGLERYASAFSDNAIEAETLAALTDEDLRELGVAAIGHRKKLLAAIAALSAPADPHAGGERRVLTIMFCDLVGSTELATRLDPEEWRDIVIEYHRAVTTAVTRFGGHVAKNLGDGALVYFGFPQAEENDAERAARAGLAILDAIAAENAALAARGGPQLAARVGIHTGPVVLGGDAEIYGDVPNISARVQSEARPGTVLVTGAVHRLISGLFVVKERGTATLKGVVEPIALFQIERTIGTGKWRATGRAVTPLIGREAELRRLRQCWDLACTGQGQLVTLMAEAGLGKSRLAAEFRNHLAGVPHLWAEFTCSQLAQDTPLKPFIDFVKPRLEEQAATPQARLETLAAWHRTIGLDPAQSLPLIAPLLELPLPAGSAPAKAPSDEQGRTLIATLARWIIGGARALGGNRAQAIVLFVEDVHWADPSTVELLKLLAEQGARGPLLLLITSRPEFITPWPQRDHHTPMVLPPLARSEIERMVGAVASHQTGLSGETIEALVGRTGGVPLFIEEVTRLLLESGDAAAQEIPLTLQASLTARLDRLGAAKEVAQIAAALGREFSYQRLRSVAGMDEPALAARLERLSAAGIIQVEGRPPDSDYRFKHALIQDAAYGTLLRQQRQALHARIIASLEADSPALQSSQPALLAHHCAEAGQIDKAVINWLRAGQLALSRSAMAEASVQLQHGLRLLTSLPDDEARRQQELDLLIALATALRFTKGYSAPDIGPILSRARELTEQLGRQEYLVLLSIAQWAFHTLRSEHHLAPPLARQIRRIGQARGNLGLERTGLRLIGQTHLYRGELATARTLLTECLSPRDPTAPPDTSAVAGVPGDMISMTLLPLSAVNLGTVLALLGHLDQAKRQLDDAIGIVRRFGQSFLLVEVLGFAGWIEAQIGATADLTSHADELSTLADAEGFAIYASAAATLRGWSASLRGDPQTGRVLIEQGLESARKSGAAFNSALGLLWLARTHAALDEPGAGLYCLAQAHKVLEATGERMYEAELHRAEAELLDATGEAVPAESAFRKALDVARVQNAKLLELQAAIGLAGFLKKHGRQAEARDLLVPLYGWFTEGFDMPDLKAAKALIAELSG